MTPEQLKRARLLSGWDIKEAARQFSMTVARYRNLEKGRTAIPDRIDLFFEWKLATLKPDPPLTSSHLLAFRRMFDLSQDQAAVLCGISRVSWNRYERNKSPVPRHLRQTIKEVVKQLKEVEK